MHWQLLQLLLLLQIGCGEAGISILGMSGGSNMHNLKELFSSATFSVNNSLVATTTATTSSSTTTELSRVTGRGIRVDVDSFELGAAGGTLRIKKAASSSGEALGFERGNAKWAIALEPETAVFSLRHSEDFRRDVGIGGVDAMSATATPALKLYHAAASATDASGARQFNLQVSLPLHFFTSPRLSLLRLFFSFLFFPFFTWAFSALLLFSSFDSLSRSTSSLHLIFLLSAPSLLFFSSFISVTRSSLLLFFFR
jgi:hypothetical protein